MNGTDVGNIDLPASTATLHRATKGSRATAEATLTTAAAHVATTAKGTSSKAGFRFAVLVQFSTEILVSVACRG